MTTIRDLARDLDATPDDLIGFMQYRDDLSPDTELPEDEAEEVAHIWRHTSDGVYQPPDRLATVEEAKTQLDAARTAVAAAEDGWRAAIRDAVDAGLTQAVVGATAGVSAMRVSQIVRGTR